LSTEVVAHKAPLVAVPTNSLAGAESWEDFISLWMVCKEVDNINQFFKGDIANRLVTKHGEGSLGEFAKSVGTPYQTIVAYRRVARAFEIRDVRNLTWTHYLIASHTDEYDKGSGTFKSDNRSGWLEKAEDEGWSSSRLAREIKKAKALVKETAVEYYSRYLDKMKNILTRIDKDDFTEEERQQFVEHLNLVYSDIRSYWEHL